MPWKTCGGRLYAQHRVAHACHCDTFSKICFLLPDLFWRWDYWATFLDWPEFTVIFVGSLMMGQAVRNCKGRKFSSAFNCFIPISGGNTQALTFWPFCILPGFYADSQQSPRSLALLLFPEQNGFSSLAVKTMLTKENITVGEQRAHMLEFLCDVANMYKWNPNLFNQKSFSLHLSNIFSRKSTP